ncbi:MAG: energy-coupling factor ABC transporter permease [Anaerolineae bacterium]|nr:energy-coupling factor ABC transporter permease [Anaerolineae bacterium]
MHIPDGFLAVVVSLFLWAVALAVLGYALKRVNRELGERQAPLMGVLAAAIFAGQMLNFTVAGGTSGHLLGATLATIVLGPWAAMLVMACVVGVQALIFQDGGLLALGANIFNMGIVGVLVSHFAYRTLRKLAGGRPWSLFAGGFGAAWLSVVVAALATALELAISGTSPANVAVPAMAAIHALIGIGEGLITVGALAFLRAARPELLRREDAQRAGGRVVWVVGLLIALALAVLSPLASTHPDGLEWVAEQQGFMNLAQSPLYAIIPDYVFPGIHNEALATIIAGMAGTVLVFFVAVGIALSRRRRARTAAS